jgi:chitin disaccharide deacetylase
MSDAPSSFPPAPPRRPVRLVVNADDFGVSERVNSGIVRAHRQGIVTATSLMAVGRAFEHAVRLSLETPALDVGVHLTLVAERPLRPDASSLAGPDGRFPPGAGAFTLGWLTGRIRRAEVAAECSAQIERVLASGIRPSHLDSHQHVHVLPGLLDLARELAGRHGIPFVRVPLEGRRLDRPLTLHGVARLLGAGALGAFAALSALWRPGPPGQRPPRFLGFHDGGRLDEVRLRRLLAGLKAGGVYELMCHPGLAPEEEDLRRWGYAHEAELQALTSPTVRAELDALGIHLCSFKDLTSSNRCKGC